MTRLNLYMPFVLNFSFYNIHSTTYNYDHLHIEQPLLSPRHGPYLANVREGGTFGRVEDNCGILGGTTWVFRALEYCGIKMERVWGEDLRKLKNFSCGWEHYSFIPWLKVSVCDSLPQELPWSIYDLVLRFSKMCDIQLSFEHFRVYVMTLLETVNTLKSLCITKILTDIIQLKVNLVTLGVLKAKCLIMSY